MNFGRPPTGGPAGGLQPMGGGLRPLGGMGRGMMPPGTAMRGMMPPGTGMGMGMMPPGTGMGPPGTGRMMASRGGMAPPPTGMQAMMMNPTLNRNVVVDDRPMTQQGMMGMKTAGGGGQGPGRQIFDRSFYIGQLRLKEAALNQEVNRLHSEWDRLQNENASFFQLARRQETLDAQVQKLRTYLKDYNLMVDRCRTTAEPEEIESQVRVLKGENTAETTSIDTIVTKRKKYEQKTQQAESVINKHQAAMQAKMEELPEEKQHLCFELRSESETLGGRVAALQEQIDELSQSVRTEEDKLMREPRRKQALHLQEKIQALDTAKVALEEEAHQAKEGFPEAKANLMGAVKQDQEEIKQMELQMRAMEDEIEADRERLTQLDSDLAENQASGSRGDQQKTMADYYEKMQRELDNWEPDKAKEKEAIGTAQHHIVTLLENISRTTGRQTQLGDADAQQHADMKANLEFKRSQMERSQQTADKMEDELNKERENKEKLAGIDKKIETEMTQLKEREEEMLAELEKFDDESKLRSDCDEHKRKLINKKNRMFRHRDTLRSQMLLANAHFQEKKNALQADNETHKQLTELTKKLAANEQTIFFLNEYVKSRTLESNYGEHKNEVHRCAEELNTLNIQSSQIRMHH